MRDGHECCRAGWLGWTCKRDGCQQEQQRNAAIVRRNNTHPLGVGGPIFGRQIGAKDPMHGALMGRTGARLGVRSGRGDARLD
jgi:hypothetical protein